MAQDPRLGSWVVIALVVAIAALRVFDAPLGVEYVVCVPAIALTALVIGPRFALVATVATASILSGYERHELAETISFLLIAGMTVGGVAYVQRRVVHVREQQRATIEFLTNEREHFLSALEDFPMPTVVVHADGTIMRVNRAFATRFGYSQREILGVPPEDVGLCVPGAHPSGDAMRAMDGTTTMCQLRAKDGTIRQVLRAVRIVPLGGAPCAICALDDLTERTEAEERLRASEGRFRLLTETMNDAYWVVDPASREFVYLSPSIERIWGRPPTDPLLRDRDGWLSTVHPDDRDGVIAAMKRQGSAPGGVDCEYRVVRPDGQIRFVRSQSKEVTDSTGRRIVVGVCDDITARRDLEVQLRQTQKMDSLGVLAGGIAHDFNNILAVVASCTSILLDSMPPDAQDRDLLQDIEEAVQRATALTRQLLAFSRHEVAQPRILDLNAVVKDAHKMLGRVVGEDVRIELSLDPELAHVRFDPGYAGQILMNLTVNARDAMSRGGRLTIETRNTVFDADVLRRHPTLPAGAGVRLSVTDTGTGIAPEVVGRIFEPFFTTKAPGAGTGMGLSVVHGIVEQLGGAIEVTSAPGKGSTFTILLPASPPPLEDATAEGTRTCTGTETLLLVDDDPYVRRASAHALERYGYKVIPVGSGRAALDVLARQHIDLLLTDVVMPEMDGRELVEASRHLQPPVKVLYTTGYTDDAVVRHGVSRGEVDLVEKPYRPEVLAARVRAVLDAGQAARGS